jgi:hypothetical protein
MFIAQPAAPMMLLVDKYLSYSRLSTCVERGLVILGCIYIRERDYGAICVVNAPHAVRTQDEHCDMFAPFHILDSIANIHAIMLFSGQQAWADVLLLRCIEPQQYFISPCVQVRNMRVVEGLCTGTTGNS